MTNKIKIEEGNVLIYVVESSRLYGDVNFWVIEAKEKGKTYKTIKAYDYTGDGFVRENTYRAFVHNSYRKSDENVYLEFDKAQRAAVKAVSEMIERTEESLRSYLEKKETWSK